jgi:hypothetical protein
MLTSVKMSGSTSSEMRGAIRSNGTLLEEHFRTLPHCNQQVLRISAPKLLPLTMLETLSFSLGALLKLYIYNIENVTNPMMIDDRL